MQKYISHYQRTGNQVLFHIKYEINQVMESRLVIGGSSGADAIHSVTLTFHHADGGFLRDGAGRPIEYTSNRHDLGHIVDILHKRLSYAYARCLIQLEPDLDFDPKDLFFHFSKLPNIGPSKSALYSKGRITLR